MALLDELDLDGVPDANADGKPAALCPAGDHHAVLCGFRTFGDDGHRDLTFKVVGGPAAGKEVSAKLWTPNGADAQKDADKRSRLRRFSRVLGLIHKAPDPADPKKAKYEPVAGKAEFSDAFGAECVVRVEHEEREYESKGQKRKATDALVNFFNIWALTDPDCPEVARGSAEQVTAAAAVGTAALPSADDFGDI